MLQRVLKPFQKAGPFHSLLSPHRFVDEHCFLTKRGHLAVVLELEGLDAGCLSDGTVAAHVASLQAAMNVFGEEFRIYQYALKHRGAVLPVENDYPTAEAEATVQERHRWMEHRGLFSVAMFWMVVYEGASPNTAAHFSTSQVVDALATGLQRNRDRLLHSVQSFLLETKDLLGARLLGKREAFLCLRRLVNLDPEIASLQPLVDDAALDYQLPARHLGVHRDGLQIGDDHLRILTLKLPPKRTRPDFFRELCRLGSNFILCTEFKQLPPEKSQSAIRDAEGHFDSFVRTIRDLISLGIAHGDKTKVLKDKAAQADVRQLGSLAKRINAGDVLGELTCTVLFYGPDQEELRRASVEALKLFGAYEASVFEETYNALNAYLAILPGNAVFNHRALHFLRSNYCDMALIFAAGRGIARNKHLGAEYLLAVETEDQTPYLLNLHNEDVFGVFITGKTGSGKSVMSNVCLDHLQKYDPITFILDVGGSYRTLCRKYDGGYMDLGHLDFRLNPFSIEESASSKRFLAGFLRMLLANEGYQVTFDDSNKIYTAVCEIYTRNRDRRRLSRLDLPDHLWAPLHRWCEGGEYGTVFDNVEDAITFSRFKVFDFQGVDQVPEIAEPLFFYLFLRHDSLVQDLKLSTTLKILWADEVWRFLSNETCRRYLVKAGKTYRKHNAGIGLATQSAFDLSNVGLLDILSELTPTKILLANPNADLEAYAKMFHFNEREVEQYRRLLPKKQFLLKREEQPAQVLNLNLSPWELAQYRNDPYGNAKRNAAIERYGFREGLKVFAADAG